MASSSPGSTAHRRAILVGVRATLAGEQVKRRDPVLGQRVHRPAVPAIRRAVLVHALEPGLLLGEQGRDVGPARGRGLQHGDGGGQRRLASGAGGGVLGAQQRLGLDGPRQQLGVEGLELGEQRVVVVLGEPQLGGGAAQVDRL